MFSDTAARQINKVYEFHGDGLSFSPSVQSASKERAGSVRGRTAIWGWPLVPPDWSASADYLAPVVHQSVRASSRALRRATLAAAVLLSGASSCGPSGPAESPDARIRRDTRIVHEPCDTDGPTAELRDVDGDGRSDLRIAFRGKQELCRSVDLNHDGRVDSWVYRAPDGSVRRRESDYDRDGRIDEIVMYSGGTLTAKQVATNLAGRLDTWQYYEGGRLIRAERDSDGDSFIDQWWEYPRTPLSDCAVVHSDVDGDGRPDPGATVDLCEDEPMPSGAPTATASPVASPSTPIAPEPPPPAAASPPPAPEPPPSAPAKVQP